MSIPSLAFLPLVASCGSEAPPTTPPLEQSSGVSGELTYVEANIDAATGGILRLPNGAELELPPGALKKSQVLRFAYRASDVAVPGPDVLADEGQDPSKDGDMFYEVTPSQQLDKAAILRLPYPLDTDWEVPELASFSNDNPISDSDSEQSLYEVEDPIYDAEKDLVTLETTHFSGFSLLTAGEPAYLVMDVPADHLEKADILMTLGTQGGALARALGSGPGWVPGHVGLFVGTNTFPSGTQIYDGGKNPKVLNGVPDSVEAIPDHVHEVNVELFRSGFHNDHLYLGARRPRGAQLSDETKEFIAQQSLRALKKPYYMLGDTGSFLGSFFKPKELVGRLVDPFATDRGYSCVGLVDVLYTWGAGMLIGSPIDRAVFALTPKDMMEATDPVRSAHLTVGQAFEMPVYGVIWKPEFSTTTARIPYTRERKVENQIVNSYDIDLVDMPDGATFNPASNGYTFSWKPETPGTYSVKFRLRADVTEKRAKATKWLSFGLLKDIKHRTKDKPLEQTFTFTVE